MIMDFINHNRSIDSNDDVLERSNDSGYQCRCCKRKQRREDRKKGKEVSYR
jgi:hypothetical protein